MINFSRNFDLICLLDQLFDPGRLSVTLGWSVFDLGEKEKEVHCQHHKKKRGKRESASVEQI